MPIVFSFRLYDSLPNPVEKFGPNVSSPFTVLSIVPILLSVHLQVYLPTYLPSYHDTDLLTYLLTYQSSCLCLPGYLSNCLSVYLPAYLSILLSLSAGLSISTTTVYLSFIFKLFPIQLIYHTPQIITFTCSAGFCCCGTEIHDANRGLKMGPARYQTRRLQLIPRRLMTGMKKTRQRTKPCQNPPTISVNVFSRVHATLQPAPSVGRSVGR